MSSTLFHLPGPVSKRHPLTGEAIVPLWIRPDGRACWPMMGGDDTNDPPADPPSDPPTDLANPPADPPPPTDRGFPANTPVAQMTPEQHAAYERHQARKHEGRATEYRTASGGRTPAEVKAALEEYDALKRDTMTERERAVEDAKREARESTAREFGTKSVRTAFELALRNLPEQDRKDFIEDLDLSRFLTDSGDVDTAKVLTRAEKIAPTDKDQGPRFDFGGGTRGTTRPESGVAAGAALYAARKKPQPTT